ncbi:MAG TPA: serine/threonine-protein kinase [Kofleriaceae bacterium]|jgi:serine/threonine-protein kinase
MQQHQVDATTPLLGSAPSTGRPTKERPVMLGDYEILGLLARGGTGGVYLGSHVQTGARVAIKMLDPHWRRHDDVVNRMLAEYEVSRCVSHVGLLEVRGAERMWDGTPYLVMELLDGENLGELVERGTIVMNAIAAIGAQIADAVAALHDAGVIHCDLKPDNVFVLYQSGLNGWPRIKVIDYGVSQREAQHDGSTIAGTPSCMPPEQWRGEPVTKSDVYALGCVLYWMVTGAPPFHGPLPQLMMSHTSALPARPSTIRDLPSELERIIMRALAKDPAMRPTMKDMARDLAAFAAQYPTTQEIQLLEAKAS